VAGNVVVVVVEGVVVTGVVVVGAGVVVEGVVVAGAGVVVVGAVVDVVVPEPGVVLGLEAGS
jgi:hypothetical protein